MSASYDRAKHIVEVDERILAVFIVDSTGKISDLFIAEDANINHSFIETIRTTLNIKVEGKNKSTEEQPLGQHLWDILEYDKVRIIKIYESERLIVVLAKSHSSPGEVCCLLGQIGLIINNNSSISTNMTFNLSYGRHFSLKKSIEKTKKYENTQRDSARFDRSEFGKIPDRSFKKC